MGDLRYLFPQVHMSLRPRSVTICWCISWSSCFVGVLCVIKQTLDDPQHLGGNHQAGEFPDWNDFHPEVPGDSRDGLKFSCFMGWITNSGIGPWSFGSLKYVCLYIPTAFVHLMTGHFSIRVAEFSNKKMSRARSWGCQDTRPRKLQCKRFQRLF